MPQLNGRGPDGTGRETGRRLGNCSCTNTEKTSEFKLGQGMGKRRKAGKYPHKKDN